jgi:hypothetical protein
MPVVRSEQLYFCRFLPCNNSVNGRQHSIFPPNKTIFRHPNYLSREAGIHWRIGLHYRLRTFRRKPEVLFIEVADCSIQVRHYNGMRLLVPSRRNTACVARE